jgi:hypothetical protein
MKRKSTFAAIALFTLISTAAFADDSPLRQLDFLAGSWKCSGEAFATPMSPGHKSVSTVETKWALGGHWLTFAFAEKKTDAVPEPVSLSGFFGYDPELAMYVIGGVDSMGGYSTASSKGRDGDTMVFTGPWHMGSMTANSRDTFIRKGDRGLVHVGEVEMDGKWLKYTEETCTK